jgi:hypothetical protein
MVLERRVMYGPEDHTKYFFKYLSPEGPEGSKYMVTIKDCTKTDTGPFSGLFW